MVAMLDFDELQEFTNIFQLGNPVKVHARSAVYVATQIIYIPHIQGLNKHKGDI